MRESNSIRSYCIIMKPSHSTEYADTVRGCVFIRKNERAYRGSERREQFHEFGALVIRACTKTVDGHGAIMEFNNAICVLSLSLSLSFFLSLISRYSLLFPFILIVFQFLLLANDAARHRRASARACRAKSIQWLGSPVN